MLKSPGFDQPPRSAYENDPARGFFCSKAALAPMTTIAQCFIPSLIWLSAGVACGAASGDDPRSPKDQGSPAESTGRDARAADEGAAPSVGAEDAEEGDEGDLSVDSPGSQATSSQGPVPVARGGTDAAGATPSRTMPRGTKVLHIGDSFAGALGKPLGELFEAAGMRSVLKHTDSSYLTDWAWDGNLQKYVWKYNPDLVMVTLGANELEIVKPELREKTVKKIVETIGDKPCVWVAIPLWDGPKNGLLDVIKQSSAPCVYMDTNTLFDTSKMARISDGIHPTTEARAVWAKDVFDWLLAHRMPLPERIWNIE
jgi:hypothetical protein